MMQLNIRFFATVLLSILPLVAGLVSLDPTNKLFVPKLQVDSINDVNYDLIVELLQEMDKIKKFNKKIEFLERNSHISWNNSQGISDVSSFTGSLVWDYKDLFDIWIGSNSLTLDSNCVLLTQTGENSFSFYEPVFHPGSFLSNSEAIITIDLYVKLEGMSLDSDVPIGFSDNNIVPTVQFSDQGNDFLRSYMRQFTFPPGASQTLDMASSLEDLCSDSNRCGFTRSPFSAHITFVFSSTEIATTNIEGVGYEFFKQPYSRTFAVSESASYEFHPENGVFFALSLNNPGESIQLYEVSMNISVDFLET